MRRVHTYIKVGRQKKINKKGGGAPERSRAKARWRSLQDRKAQSRRTRSFTNLPRQKGADRELGQDSRRGRDALHPPEALTEEVRHTPWPSSLKAWSAHLVGPRSTSGGTGPGAQDTGGRSPGSCITPGQAEARRTLLPPGSPELCR